jgi:homoserine kinase
MKTVRLRLPATSANLGPGFDAMALALELFLEIEAVPAPSFSIAATGRNRDICAGLNRNLLIETYQSILVEEQKPVAALEIRMHNEIPVGMGCVSSAAVRLAGVAPPLSAASIGMRPPSLTGRRGSKAIRTTWPPAGMGA